MRKFDRILFGSLAAMMILFILGGVLVTTASPRGDIYEYLTNFREVLHLVNSSYVDEVSTPRMMEGAFQGMMESLDAASVYLDPEQHERYRRSPGGGDQLGLTVSKRYSYAVIVAVAPDSPAALGGLRAGDLIRSIDGRMVREMNRLDVEDALRGEKGSEVLLAVIYQQTAERDEVPLVRGALPPAPPEFVRLPDGVAYLRLHGLGPGSADSAAALLVDAVSAAAGAPAALLLDLRNNPGGELDEAVKLADLFLSAGAIVSVEGQQVAADRRQARGDSTRFTGPLSVLVDRGTAGEAEVLAAALQQNDRAAVVGEQSFGLGSIQKLVPLSNGGALLLSVAQYHAPDGTAIPGEGVTPDEELELEPEDAVLEPRTGITAEQLAADPFVRHALALLQPDDEDARKDAA